MANPTLRFKRGTQSAFASVGLSTGEPAFITDEHNFYIGLDGNSTTNKFFGSSRYWRKETASKGSGVNLVESTGGLDFITLAAPASVGAAITYTFPGTITDGYFLKTNSTGDLSWDAVVSDFTIAADSGSPDTVSTGSTITFTGGTNVNTAVTDDTITINLDNDISVTNLNVSGISTFVGVATFTTNNVYIDNQLYVGGVQVTGGASIVGEDITARNLSLSGIATVTGLIDANGGLDVTGHTELDNLNVSGITTLAGTVYLGDNTSDDINVGGEFVSNLTPSTNNFYDLGTSSQRWRNVWVSGDLNVAGVITATRFNDILISNKDAVFGYIDGVSETDDTANHGGIAVASTEGSPLIDISVVGINTLPSTYKQLMWIKSGTFTGLATDAWMFNYGVAIGTTTMASGVRLAVGTGVTISDTSVSATTFYGTLSGNSSSSDQVKTVTASDTNATYYVTFVDANNGSATNETVYTDDGIYYNPGTNTLTTQNGFFTGNVTVEGNITVAGSVIGTATTATRATTVDTTGIADNQNYNLTFTNGSGTGKTVGVDSELLYNPNTNTLTVSNLTVNGTTTQVNTSTLTVEDNLIELAKVDGSAPSSDLNKDVGVLLHYYDTAARLGAVYWDDSVSRIVLASRVGESSGVLTVDSGYYAPVEIGSLWVTDCAGTSQVISCTGTERFLENITVDGGTF